MSNSTAIALPVNRLIERHHGDNHGNPYELIRLADRWAYTEILRDGRVVSAGTDMLGFYWAVCDRPGSADGSDRLESAGYMSLAAALEDLREQFLDEFSIEWTMPKIVHTTTAADD